MYMWLQGNGVGRCEETGVAAGVNVRGVCE